METFSALLAVRAGNSPVPGEFPVQRPVTPSFDLFFDLRLNKRWSKQSWGWWFETLSRPLRRHCNEITWTGMSQQRPVTIYTPLGFLRHVMSPKVRLVSHRINEMTSNWNRQFIASKILVLSSLYCIHYGQLINFPSKASFANRD